MLADPQSLTINAVATPVPATSRGTNTSTYRSADGNTVFGVSHNYGKRTRRTVRIDLSKIAPDPLVSDQSIKYSMSAYIVVDIPVTGYTPTEAKYAVDALTAWLTAGSGANTVKVLGGES